MKKILVSIKPKYVKEILNHRKTLEIRKSCPKCELPCEVYIYCTKGGKQLVDCPQWVENELYHQLRYDEDIALPKNSQALLNGKVVAKFTLNKTYLLTEEKNGYVAWCGMPCFDPTKEACLSQDDLRGYLKGKDGYAWLIDQKSLKIFDKPKELKEFNKIVSEKKYKGLSWQKPKEELIFECVTPLTNAPQSYCYCEVDE